jgi:hypothetical protein
VDCEVISGGKGLRAPAAAIAAHALAAAHFAAWAGLYGAALHWPAAANAWVLMMVAAGTGLLVSGAALATASDFSARNIASNIEPEGLGLRHLSGLVHVGAIVRASLAIAQSAIVPPALQLGYLAFRGPCCSWSGPEAGDAGFLATYVASLLYCHAGALAAVQVLYADLRPVYQLTDSFRTYPE